MNFKFLPRPARKKLEQIHNFKQSAPDHQTPEGNLPFPNLGENHAAIPWTHQVFGSSATRWRHRGKVPGDAKMRLINFFDAPFQIIDEPQPRQIAGAGMTLAQQAARFIVK